MLLCPVRDCRLPLKRDDRRVACRRGHSFDVARSGYINLLQPQDRRSAEPGDTVEAMRGRRRLHDSGATQPFVDVIAELVGLSSSDIVLDAGCGDGFYLGSLAARFDLEGHGVDISVPAIDVAAKRYPGCHWIVANADRFVPYADHSFSVVLSITARMNPAEFRRVLRSDGRLLVALPGPEDFVELRGTTRDRVSRTVDAFSPDFELTRQRQVTTFADLSSEDVSGVRHSIYRPFGAGETKAMRVTLSFDLLAFQVRS